MKSLILTLSIITGGILLAALFIGGILVSNYNGLITSKTNVETSRAQIEAELQRRFDLVPGLVSSVRGAMKQEQAVFDGIAEARTRYAGAPTNSSEKIQAGQQYESALSRLLVVMENYPQLQSIGTVKDLMVQLEGTENRLSVARTRYNEVVQTHNTRVRQFPTNLMAGLFGIKEESLFQSDEGAKSSPKVNFEDI